MKTTSLGLATCLVVTAAGLPLASPAPAADPDLAQKAHAVLTIHCHRCHGRDGTGKGGLSFILDRDRLVARNKVVPGSAAESELYQRVRAGEMPPEDVPVRPGPGDLEVLRQWIEAGAPAFRPAGPRAFASEAEVVRHLLADLKALPPRQRRFVRYFTFTNLTNAGLSEGALQTYRHGLSKLVNSLSWHPRLTVPAAIDPAGTIVRIDLRDFQWNARVWDRILSAYPYRLPPPGAAAKVFAAATGTELPYVRADWFVATASRPPLYHELLQLPTTERELERLLRVDALRDIDEGRVARSGFNGSGVSKNNRLIERHDAAFGAYWRSYDFSDNVDRQNLFDHPLGPQPGQNSFQHAGGEIIFHLPNGLQAYLLVDGTGRRVDRAPVEIVSDPGRPDRTVATGLSCMACHARGLIHKADQVRAHVEKNPAAFSPADVETVQALYPPEAQFKALLEEDVARFQKAVRQTGAAVGDPEPITALTLRYEGELDRAAAAAEAGLAPDDFARRLRGSAGLSRVLGPLNVPGGTVQRQVFLAAFAELVRELRLGDVSGPPAIPAELAATAGGGLRPFAGHTGPVLSIAFAPDGRRALSGSEDNTLRLWDVDSGRELRRFQGHTGEVLAVAFSPDGRRALSGSYDRTIRLWDVASGRELRRFEGHTERVSGVAFAPDGRRALSGSWDQMLSLWDVDSGRELRRFGGHTSYISSVAFSPDGRLALSGGYDQTVRLWDVDNGRELRRFQGHTKEVYTVAFAPDGRLALSGGNDASVRLWDVDSGRELRRFPGHTRAVIRVAFTADGRRVLSGSSRYQGTDRALRVWDVASGRELGSYGGQADTVWSLAFTPDGRRALSGSSDQTLRLWELPR